MEILNIRFNIRFREYVGSETVGFPFQGFLCKDSNLRVLYYKGNCGNHGPFREPCIILLRIRRPLEGTLETRGSIHPKP